MKRKFLSLAATVVLLVTMGTALSACSRGGETAAVHVFYYSYSDTYVSSVRSALDKLLAEQSISYQDYDGNANQTTQTEQVQTAITKGAKVILVNVVNTGSDDASAGIVTLAKNAGIPVIFFNREVSDTVVNSYDKCAFVGTDAAEAGHLQGEMIGDYVRDNFKAVDINGDGKISYVLFKGEEGNNEAVLRTRYAVEGANEVLDEADLPALSFYDPSNTNGYLVDKNGQWSAAAANEYMTTALTSYNEKNNNMIELIICNNDGMAEGAVSALGTAGYNTGEEGARTVPVFGVDATDAAKELIKNGKMTGTVKQDAAGMAGALTHLAKNGLEGKTLLSNTEDYHVDDAVAKVRIAYGKYMGE